MKPAPAPRGTSELVEPPDAVRAPKQTFHPASHPQVDEEQCTNSQTSLNHETVMVVVGHGLLIGLLLWFLTFLVPSFTAFKGLAMKPPTAFMFVFNIAFFLRRFVMAAILGSIALLWMDAFAYRAIRSWYEPSGGLIWFMSVAVILLAILVFCLIAITAPLRW